MEQDFHQQFVAASSLKPHKWVWTKTNLDK